MARLEDPTTEKLAQLLNSNRAILSRFLRFLLDNQELLSRYIDKRLDVTIQHPFTNSRLDLLIQGERSAIIIECKVGDRPSINKLEKYHREWTRLHGFPPDIFWLVRRRGGELGLNRYLKREVLWNELDASLGQSITAIHDESVIAAVEDFRRHLKETGILLRSGEKDSRRPRQRSYNDAFAEKLLEEIAARFADTQHEVIPPGDVPHHRLFIGRQSWKETFQDEWVKRVVLRFKPASAQSGAFTLSGAILFWNRSYVPNPDFAIRRFPTWAAICHAAGMRIGRSGGSKWPGKYVVILEPPFKISRPVKYFGADGLVPDDRLPIFQAIHDKTAIDEGCRVIRQLFQIVDRF